MEADQVTYDLHIILRFEIEVKLIERQLAVADVPACWNEEFEKMLGLKVTKDADGCLQDIHWSKGMLGYFPTYTLGNLNASQLMRQAALDLPALEAELARGEYGALREWLSEKIPAGPAPPARGTDAARHRRTDAQRLPSRFFAEKIRGGLSCKNPRSLRLTISHWCSKTKTRAEARVLNCVAGTRCSRAQADRQVGPTDHTV